MLSSFSVWGLDLVENDVMGPCGLGMSVAQWLCRGGVKFYLWLGRVTFGLNASWESGMKAFGGKLGNETLNAT